MQAGATDNSRVAHTKPWIGTARWGPAGHRRSDRASRNIEAYCFDTAAPKRANRGELVLARETRNSSPLQERTTGFPPIPASYPGSGFRQCRGRFGSRLALRPGYARVVAPPRRSGTFVPRTDRHRHLPPGRRSERAATCTLPPRATTLAFQSRRRLLLAAATVARGEREKISRVQSIEAQDRRLSVQHRGCKGSVFFERNLRRKDADEGENAGAGLRRDLQGPGAQHADQQLLRILQLLAVRELRVYGKRQLQQGRQLLLPRLRVREDADVQDKRDVGQLPGAVSGGHVGQLEHAAVDDQYRPAAEKLHRADGMFCCLVMAFSLISDVAIGDMLTNIFPDSLQTLIIQRSKLTQFDPRGSHAFTSVSTLDLRDNQLSDIPTIIYEMRNLSALYLQGNAIADAHVTLPQLQYLQKLPVFEANLTVNGSCSTGYDVVSWADKSVCYTNGDGLGSINSSGSNDKSTSSTASGSSSSSVAVYVVLGLALFVVLAVVGGVVLLRQMKKKTAQEQHDSFVSADGKIKANLRSLRARMGALNGTAQTTELEASLNEYNFGGGVRKAAFKEIPATDVVVLNQLSTSGPVTVALAEHCSRLVLVTKLQTSDDDVEAALDMIPALSQMRHPQILSIIGLAWDERHAMTAVCEYMTLGTLEAYLRSAGTGLNWTNFKMKAAAEIARGLMYLHSQHKVTYDGLNGRSVFVDPEKGCKLNPVQAALPTNGSSPYSCHSYYRRCDSTTKAFFAPEVLIGEPSRSSSDMYAFGVLLAHLDTCQTADEMIRSSWRMRTHIGDFDSDNGTLLSTDGTVVNTGGIDFDSSRRRTTQLESLPSTNGSRTRSVALEENRRRTTPVLGTQNNDETSLLSMFTFTPECPTMVRELAGACLQLDTNLWSSTKNDPSDRGPSECTICLESMGDSLAGLPCGHVFHAFCLEEALATREACPVCRNQASARDPIRLYLTLGDGGSGRRERCRHDSSYHEDGFWANASRSEILAAAPRLTRHLRKMQNAAEQVGEPRPAARADQASTATYPARIGQHQREVEETAADR
ncbi:hypothetical protein ON010_g6620 [Phytophthora cinnamomi]|nr:hypothetical protein ON010_g6620 [Phytophthora cinnamomi]